jgi:hypothetical protein
MKKERKKMMKENTRVTDEERKIKAESDVKLNNPSLWHAL